MLVSTDFCWFLSRDQLRKRKRSAIEAKFRRQALRGDSADGREVISCCVAGRRHQRESSLNRGRSPLEGFADALTLFCGADHNRPELFDLSLISKQADDCNQNCGVTSSAAEFCEISPGAWSTEAIYLESCEVPERVTS
jgi:hypothetical protein